MSRFQKESRIDAENALTNFMIANVRNIWTGFRIKVINGENKNNMSNYEAIGKIIMELVDETTPKGKRLLINLSDELIRLVKEEKEDLEKEYHLKFGFESEII